MEEWWCVFKPLRAEHFGNAVLHPVSITPPGGDGFQGQGAEVSEITGGSLGPPGAAPVAKARWPETECCATMAMPVMTECYEQEEEKSSWGSGSGGESSNSFVRLLRLRPKYR